MNGRAMRFEYPVYLFLEPIQMLNVFQDIRTENDVKGVPAKWQIMSIVRNDREDGMVLMVVGIEIDSKHMMTFFPECRGLPAGAGAEFKNTCFLRKECHHSIQLRVAQRP